MYDKRIILDNGTDTIPFGYHWTRSTVSGPASTVSVPPLLELTGHMLFSLIHPSTAQASVCHQDPNPLNDRGGIIGTDGGEMDLLTTDDESEMDYESENDQDRSFVNDVEVVVGEEESFYRRYDNNF